MRGDTWRKMELPRGRKSQNSEFPGGFLVGDGISRGYEKVQCSKFNNVLYLCVELLNMPKWKPGRNVSPTKRLLQDFLYKKPRDTAKVKTKDGELFNINFQV